jgi:uncharacterized membrane protein
VTDPEEHRAGSSARGLVMVLVSAALIALVLRIVGLTREPMWLDEVLTWEHSSGSFSEVLKTSAKDVHPPGYYLGIMIWRVAFGESPAGLRSYSVLWSLVGIMAVAWLASRLSSSLLVPAVAGMLMAVNPLDVYYAQEARSYSQLAALGVIATAVLWSWLAAEERGVTRGRPVWVLVYALAAASIMYSHYLGAFLVIAHAAWVTWWVAMRRHGGVAGFFAASAVIAIVLYLPWIDFHQHAAIRFYREAYLGWISTPALTEAVSFVWHDIFRAASSSAAARVFSSWVGITLVAACAASLIIGLATRRLKLAPVTVVIWMLLGPPTLAVAVSNIWEPIYFRPRFAVLMVPYLAVLFAMACRGLPRRSLGVALATTAIAAMLVSTVFQYRSVTKRGMPEFAELYSKICAPELLAVFPRNLTSMASYYANAAFSYPSRKQVKTLSQKPGTRAWVLTAPGFEAQGPERQRQRRDQILALGPHRLIARTDGLAVLEVRPRGDVQPPNPGKPPSAETRN